MNKQPTTSKSGALSRLFKATFPAGLLAASVFLLSAPASQAGSATWKANPTSGNWNTASNWTPSTIPNSSSDTATFGVSNTTDVALSASTEVSGIVFSAGANAFTITATRRATLVISGAGITNNSGVTQNFVFAVAQSGATRGIFFGNNATAGNMTSFDNNGSFIGFAGTSSAGHGIFVTNNSGGDGNTVFFDTSTAGDASLTNNGGAVSGEFGGRTAFLDSSSAGNATLIANAGAVLGGGAASTGFADSSSAGNARLIANGGSDGNAGGSIQFFQHSKGSTARVEVFGNGNLDISDLSKQGITVGSIKGGGNVFLGARNLTVGSNNLSTKFSGVIADRGGLIDARGGSLTKIGTGKLVLSHRSSYTGGTTINAGRIVVNNIGGSGTGSGPVQVRGGKLAGKGEIAGAVTVGTGTGGGAVLAPGYLHGIGSPGALTIHSPLTFNSDATYEVGMNSSSVMADEVVALGVTINGAAQFAFVDIGSGSLPAGTTFTVINNTAATPIAGTFRNLPDGATFTSNGNKYKANYEGGDGNDLTLTVVP